MKKFLYSFLFVSIFFFIHLTSIAQWVQTGGPAGASVRAFAVSPNGTGGTNLFAGTRYDVFLSTNNGTSWTPVNNGLSTEPSVTSFAVSPDGTGGTNLFAGTPGSGVFLSTNNGTSWTSVSNGLTNTNVGDLAVSSNGSGGTNLFAGTCYSPATKLVVFFFPQIMVQAGQL